MEKKKQLFPFVELQPLCSLKGKHKEREGGAPDRRGQHQVSQDAVFILKNSGTVFCPQFSPHCSKV